MPLDVQKTLVDGFWAVAEARTGAGQFANVSKPLVKAGNRIKTNKEDWIGLLNDRKAYADFPFVSPFFAGGGANYGVRSFGTGLPIATFDQPVAIPVRADIRVAFDDMIDANVFPLEAEIDVILHLLFQSLREHAIRPIPPTWVKSRTTTGVGNVQRISITWTDTIECRPYLSSLLS